MAPSEPAAAQSGTSPSASGPAGAFFEAQVAAHYLLTMLAEADPRGLPGVSTDRVELQRSGEGYPLDDVIIKGVTRLGDPAVLEVQVKRTITFSPGDTVFKGVVKQLAQAFRTLDLTHQRHQFAVATERTSFKITGPYQDVLRWARELSSASVFFGRIGRSGVGNDDMRAFVETVRTHLQSAGCMSDDESVWQLLRRFQILTFDYDAPGSQSLELALERARNLLDPTDAPRASAFWKVLTETSIRVAAAGGDLDRSKLLDELASVDRFRLLDSRRNRVPRETLTETAVLAAADLRRSILGVTLTRSAQLDAVREARDQGRYAEIRGGPGVGKSGLLGMLVDQVLTEGHAIVLTPDRTIPGGWLALKSALQIEGGPEAFLSDLASDGGAVLFVDSLDFFDDPSKRITVTDLVRAAAAVPGFQVIVTARTDFDKDEPNWLPPEALARLGRANPVILDELGTEEIEELKDAAPPLSALLAEDHPARAVARNLFRLSRLLEVEGPTDQLRSEVDLLELWWKTADGPRVGLRDRKRLLAEVTDAILAGSDHEETRAESSVVDALVTSGTLRELGLDRLVYCHDVLREWGVAARLHEAPEKIDQLPLTRAVPPSLARGLELGARFALERSEDGQAWGEYLNRVSHSGAHASWRRWALLAILRSELAFTLLDRASASLTENDGVLLRELIRTTLAVESRPLVETLAEYGVNAEAIPAGVYGPNNGSWATLVRWLLLRRARLPLSALPDVVELFQSLSASMFFSDPATPKMAVALADWLEEIEDAQEHHPLAADQPRFARAFRYRDLQDLASHVRQAFLLMASSVPERAQGYLRRLLGRRNSEYTIGDIMKFRGTLAQAAPIELVEITLAGLIPKEDGGRRSATRTDAFTYLDSHYFLPGSPAQGPFFDLLNVAPEHGLRLIRRLVGHAIAVQTTGREPDGFTLVFSTGVRFFPWERSFSWSRQAGGGYAVQSGLLAMEAWGHRRIERGDAPEQVIADVLGPEGSPAAFLLVAVDLLISHWPKTMAAAIPFLGSPELLSLDRSRQIHFGADMTLGGWGVIGSKEPAGPIQLADLQRRPSRRQVLESLLPSFAFGEPADRNTLHALLSAASGRLGPPELDDTFAVPRLMACYAINLIDPANWPSDSEGHRSYVSPPEEAQHLRALQEKYAALEQDFGIDVAIENALEDDAKSSPELAERAVSYVQRLSTANATPDGVRSRTNAVVSAAMLLARDGADATLDQHEDWVRDVFAQAFASKEDITVTQMRDGIRFNPVATAALGLIHLWRRRGRQDDRDALLELAGRDDPHAAQGFGAGVAAIRELDPRLLPALLRCALVAQVHPTYEWDTPEGVKKARKAQHRECVSLAIRAEVAWLNGDGPEQAWPPFPLRMISVRRPLRIGGDDAVAPPARETRQSEQLYSQSASLWLRQLTRGSDAVSSPWIVSFVDAYADWTAAANGAGLEQNAEIESRIDEWNSVFLSLLASAFPRMTPEEAAAHVERASAVPDKSFFGIASELVPAIDRVYFEGLGLDLSTALRLRTLLADRLVDTAGWRRERDRSEMSVETRIGPAIAALFFNYHNPFSVTSCYLGTKGIDQVDPFLPGLARLIGDGPVPFSGLLAMNLLEVSPRPAHLQFLLSSALGWLQRQPANPQLWVDGRLGERVAKWLEEILRIDGGLRLASHSSRPQIDDVLARLVQLGVAQAHRIEALLAATFEPNA